MHAKVYQITKHRVDKENYLNENTLTQGDSSDYDYCSEISEEERAESIDTLVNQILPKGMFTLVGSDELVFNSVLCKCLHKIEFRFHTCTSFRTFCTNTMRISASTCRYSRFKYLSEFDF